MASDNQTHYGRIGFVILAGLAAVLFALVYLAGIWNAENEVLVETYFDCSVYGLSRGSPVNFRGVTIGEVREIRLSFDSGDLADLQTIRVVMALDAAASGAANAVELRRQIAEAIRLGVHAELDSNVVTGISRIELLFPEQPIKDRRITWAPKYPLVPPAPSMFDAITGTLQQMQSKLDEMNFAAAWSNVEAVASNAAAITTQVDSLLESRSAALAATVENLRALTENLRALSEELRTNPSLLLRPNDPEPLMETRP